MASFDILTWDSTGNKTNRTPSSTSTVDFTAVRIGADNLTIGQTGSGAGASFNFNNRILTGVSTPVGSGDAANKAYVDTAVVMGGRVREAILSTDQQSNTQGIKAALPFYMIANPIVGDTLVLKNGGTTETFTFAAASGAHAPLIGGSAAATMQNLATRINTDSTTWTATWEPSALASINAGGVVILIESATAAGASASRIYGTWATQTNAKLMAQNGSVEYSTGLAVTSLPSTDPGTVSFGMRRQLSAMINGEIHLALSGDLLSSWDNDSGAWLTLSAGGISTATSGPGGGTLGKATFDSSKGLVAVAGVVSIQTDSSSLGFNSGNLAVQLADSSLAIASGLKVNAGGIGPTQLNTSAAGNGLTGGGGSALSVVAQDGIRTNSSGVSVDYTATLTNDNAGAATIGQIVYVKSNGHFDLALATVSNLQNNKLGAVYAATISSGGSGAVTLRVGAVVDGFSGLTPGGKVWVSNTTAGAVTQTLSSWTAGQHVYAVGRAISATQIVFDPQYEILF